MKLMALSAVVVKSYPLITAPLFLYLFTKDEFGALDYAYYVMSLGCILFTMGIHNGYARYALDVAIDLDLKVKKYSYILTSAFITITLALTLILIVNIFELNISNWMPEVLHGLLFEFSFYILSGTLAYTALTAERFSLNAKSLLVITSIIYILPLATLILLYFTYNKFAIWLVLMTQTVFNLIAFTISFYGSICKIKLESILILVRKYIIYSLPLLFALVGEALISFSSRLFLTRLYPEELGDFAIASRIASVVLILNFFISFMFHPLYYRECYKKTFFRFWSELYNTFIIIYCLLIIISPIIVEIVCAYLNKKLEANIINSLFLILNANLLAGLQIFHLGMHVKEKTIVVGLIYLITIPISFVFNYILISQYQMIGASWALVATMIWISIPYIYISNKYSLIKLKTNILAKSSVFLMILYFLIYLFDKGIFNYNNAVVFSLIFLSLFIFEFKVLIKAYNDIY